MSTYRPGSPTSDGSDLSSSDEEYEWIRRSATRRAPGQITAGRRSGGSAAWWAALLLGTGLIGGILWIAMYNSGPSSPGDSYWDPDTRIYASGPNKHVPQPLGPVVPEPPVQAVAPGSDPSVVPAGTGLQSGQETVSKGGWFDGIAIDGVYSREEKALTITVVGLILLVLALFLCHFYGGHCLDSLFDKDSGWGAWGTLLGVVALTGIGIAGCCFFRGVDGDWADKLDMPDNIPGGHEAKQAAEATKKRLSNFWGYFREHRCFNLFVGLIVAGLGLGLILFAELCTPVFNSLPEEGSFFRLIVDLSLALPMAGGLIYFGTCILATYRNVTDKLKEKTGGGFIADMAQNAAEKYFLGGLLFWTGIAAIVVLVLTIIVCPLVLSFGWGNLWGFATLPVVPTILMALALAVIGTAGVALAKGVISSDDDDEETPSAGHGATEGGTGQADQGGMSGGMKKTVLKMFLQFAGLKSVAKWL